MTALVITFLSGVFNAARGLPNVSVIYFFNGFAIMVLQGISEIKQQ